MLIVFIAGTPARPSLYYISSANVRYPNYPLWGGTKRTTDLILDDTGWRVELSLEGLNVAQVDQQILVKLRKKIIKKH